jgi:histidinol-phosphatase (PHP family)
MIKQNLHTHSTFDDGQNTMEEMALAAVSAGLNSLGFSAHTPMPFDDGWGWTIAPERLPDYHAEISRLKKTFQGRLEIYDGAEWDILSQMDLSGFDFIIGSIHYIEYQGGIYSVDAAADCSSEYLERVFSQNTDTAAEAYFRQYAALAKVDEVDIVGHYDLLTKFDEQMQFYHSDSPRFREAALAGIDALIAADKIFEINTGAISRGYRTTPYPSRSLLKEIFARNGRITISADAHRAQDVAFAFSEAEALAQDCGFTETWQFDGRDFVSVPLTESGR